MNTGGELQFQPVIIIGAGRSGTNALRDALTGLPGFETWKCDEINPIWRHGNIHHPNDELQRQHATLPVKNFIRGAFTRIWSASGKPRFVVEKTCANSLRVNFIDEILPEARFIHFVRNGYDVLASARKRWNSELEVPALPYFYAKARYVPLRDLPIYGFQFLRNRWGRITGKERRLKQWGPRYDGMGAFSSASLEEVCARQWIACVNSADAAFAGIDPARVLVLRYEDMVADPVSTLREIMDFLDADVPAETLATSAATVRGTSVGRGRKQLGDLPLQIVALMRAPLQRHGYEEQA